MFSFSLNSKRADRLRLIKCVLFGLLLSFPIATKTVAETWHISDKEKNEISTNHEERQIIKLFDEKSVYKHITAVAWSPDGKSIATSGGTTQVTIWDSASLSIRYQLDQGSRGHGDDNITFSPDSQCLASGLRTVNVWNVADGVLRTTLIAPHITPEEPSVDIQALRFSPDGRMLVVVYNGKKQKSRGRCLLVD